MRLNASTWLWGLLPLGLLVLALGSLLRFGGETDTEACVAARERLHQELQQDRPDYESDFLASVSIEAPQDFDRLEVHVYDQRELFMAQWAGHPFALPPTPRPLATRVFHDVEENDHIVVRDVGYGRKQVELRGHVEGSAPVIDRQRLFVHEGLGSTLFRPAMTELDARRMRFVGPDGDPLRDASLQAWGDAWSAPRAFETDSKGYAAISSDTRWVSADLVADERRLWFALTGSVKRTLRAEIAPVRLPLPAEAAASRLFARAITADGLSLPLPARSSSDGRFAELDAPTSPSSVEILLELADGSRRLARLAARSDEPGFEPVVSDSSPSPWRSLAPVALEAPEGDAWISWRGPVEPGLWTGSPLDWLRAAGARIGAFGDEVAHGWSDGHLYAVDSTEPSCVRWSQGAEEWPIADAPVELPILTFRAFDNVVARTPDETLVALGFTHRYAEWTLETNFHDAVLVSSTTWHDFPGEANGARLGVDEVVGVADEALAEPSPNRVTVSGYLLRENGEPIAYAPLIAQYYPGGGRFGHRQTKTNAHGFFRLNTLPVRAPVDLILRDPGDDEDGNRRVLPRASRRIFPQPNGTRPMEWRLPAGQVMVRLDGLASVEDATLELRQETEQPIQGPLAEGAEPAEAYDTVIWRRLSDEDRRVKFEGIEPGEYVVVASDPDGNELWSGDVVVAVND